MGKVSIGAGTSIQSVAVTDFRNSEASVEVVDGTPDAGGGAQLVVGNGRDGEFIVYTAISAKDNTSPVVIFGSWNLYGIYQVGQLPWDPVAMRWWRLRENAGYIAFDFSPDAYVWTTFSFYEHGILQDAVASMRVRLEHIVTRNAGPVVFDNLNTPYVEEPDIIPREVTLQYMRASPALRAVYPGTDVNIALLDQGTTAAVRARQNVTLVAQRHFATPPANGAEIDPDGKHGCLCMSCGIPYGGRLIDGRVFNGEATYAAIYCAAMTWAVDQGAKIISCSFGGGAASQLEVDTFNALSSKDVQIYIATGNEYLNDIDFPAKWGYNYPGLIHMVGAFDELTDTRPSFSNHTANMTGVAPGLRTGGRMPGGARVTWSGTSAATPHAAGDQARTMSGNRYTSVRAGQAMRQGLRQTGQSATDQGGGAYSVSGGLQQLGATGGGGSVIITTV